MKTCGQQTRSGSPCKIKLVNGKCLTHSLSDDKLKARNSKVRASFAEAQPIEYKRHQHRAAKLGFKATAQLHGFAAAYEKSRLYRIEHPSAPEKRVMEILDAAGVEYEREYPFGQDGRYTIDFVLDGKIGLFINGYQYKDAPFGNDGQAIREKQARQVEYLQANGWIIYVVRNDEIDEKIPQLL